jgi:outer membrane protein assembly factor BamE
MPFIIRRCLIFIAWIGVVATVSACGSARTTSDKVASLITPYKIDIVQGNVVTREQLELLRVGMPRAIAQDILGTPLLTSVFHAERWDYVFTLQRQGSVPQARKVTLFFANDVISQIEADELPREAEFVSTLRTLEIKGQVPALIATEEALKKFPAPQKSATPATPVTASPQARPATSTYPALEPIGR